MSKINIFGLGGLQENGKNLYVVEIDEKLFILDAGLKYPTSQLYGVDIIIPDISYLIENKKRIAGVFLTHAHDDHIGGIVQILKDIKTKVYATKFTHAIVKDLINENGLNIDEKNLVEISSKSIVKMANVTIRFFEVAHNIPGCVGIVIGTTDGNIVYTGNYTFDQNSKADFQAMYYHLARYSKEGVLALLTDSLGANNEDSRGTIFEFKKRINNIFASADGRIIFSLFSSDLQRIQQIVDIAITYNRRVAILGRKTQKIVNQAINLGYLKIPDKYLVNFKFIDEKNQNNDPDLVVLVTGDRHEPYFMLQRMSKKIDRLVKLEEHDTVVVLTVPYIGTEKMAARTLDMIYKVTSRVKVFGAKLLPAPFATREEMKAMINILKPKYLLPVIGEYRHQYAFITVAECVDFNKDNIVILDNGDKLEINDGISAGITSSVSVGEIMIDGRAVGDVGDVVMRDRELLAQDGVLLLVANINPKTKKVVSGPRIISKGFSANKEDDVLNEQIIDTFKKVSIKHLVNRFINWSEYKNDLKGELNRLIYKTTKNNPIVIPVLISTDVDQAKNKKVKPQPIINKAS